MKSKSVTAYLKHPVTPDLNQPGGVLSMVIGDTTSSVVDQGRDDNLGRWSWVTLRGKHNIKTTIITGYRPCGNTSTQNTVVLQQQRYLAAKHMDKHPRQIWLDKMGDLVKEKNQPRAPNSTSSRYQ